MGHLSNVATVLINDITSFLDERNNFLDFTQRLISELYREAFICTNFGNGSLLHESKKKYM